MGISFASFSDEFVKIATEDKLPPKNAPMYSPGIVAHEAGHAWMHRQTKPGDERKHDVMGTAELVGGLLPLGVLAGSLAIRKRLPSPRELYGSAALGFSPRLVDEYASSIRAHLNLKKTKALDKPLTDEERKQERNKLIAAGSTYAMLPVSMLSQGEAHQRDDPRWMLGSLGALAGQVGALTYASTAKGPKITAREAKALVQEIAPGTPVYATRETFAGGSAYLPPVKNKLMRALTDQSLQPYFDKAERTKIMNEGGIMIAPMSKKNVTSALLASIGGGQGGLDDKFKEVK